MVYFLALIEVEILSLQIQKFDEIASFLAMTDWNEKQENGRLILPESFAPNEFYFFLGDCSVKFT